MAKSTSAPSSRASKKPAAKKSASKRTASKNGVSKKAAKSTVSAKNAATKKTSTKATGSTATKTRATNTRSKDKPSPEKKKQARPAKFKKVSRAVTRLVEPGSQVDCMHCGERVKFQAKMRHQQVICNVYEKHQWLRVDHYHADCYKTAKQPYGKPVD